MNRGRSVWFWTLAAIGWGVMAYAIRGLLMHSSQTHPFSVIALIVGGDLLHDVVVAPAVLLLGAVGVARLPPALRRATTVGLVISGSVALYAYPFVRGFGRTATTPSRLPNNYAVGLGVVLACVWACVLGGSLVLHARRARR